jgi:hypothetical protein
MVWANFLHFYQPPTQKPYWITRITKESYRPIVEGLLAHPGAKITLNISAVLLEQLDRYDQGDIIDGLRTLLERGQIELTGSAKYHALLPFLPEAEARRQIRLNQQVLRHYFGSAYQPAGFFPPEMAVTPDIMPLIRDEGFSWVIADEYSCPGGPEAIAYDRRYLVKDVDGLGIYFRERRVSWSILAGELGTPSLVKAHLGKRLQRPEFLLTAMDGETFGHHRPGLENLLFDLTDEKELPPALISELSTIFTQATTVEPQPSTWAFMDKTLERSAPFIRWHDPDNTIHTEQWALLELALTACPHHDDPTDPREDALDRALHSDQFWWASARPWWSIEMIEAGAKELVDAIAASPDATAAHRQQAEAHYRHILAQAFDWQRSGKVDELARRDDEELRQAAGARTKLPRAEVEAMIKRLRRDMHTAANREDFERAASLRDRARELGNLAGDTDVVELGQTGTQDWNH